MKAPNSVKKIQGGFTLIELMIVVAIIGILSAVAIPAYNDYTQKAQVADAFTEAASIQTAVVAFAQENGTYPAQADIANGIGASVTGKYSTAQTDADTGVVIVKMAAAGIAGADVANETITFTPPAITGATNWNFECTSTVKQKYLPKNCSGA